MAHFMVPSVSGGKGRPCAPTQYILELDSTFPGAESRTPTGDHRHGPKGYGVRQLARDRSRRCLFDAGGNAERRLGGVPPAVRLAAYGPSRALGTQPSSFGGHSNAVSVDGVFEELCALGVLEARRLRDDPPEAGSPVPGGPPPELPWPGLGTRLVAVAA